MLHSSGIRATTGKLAGMRWRWVSDWDQWLAQAQRGDATAYHNFLEAAAVHVRRRYTRRMFPGEVDDLVQDVLLAVHAKRATYDPKLPALPWLNAITHYKWVDRVRRHVRDAFAPLETDIADERDDNPAARHAVNLMLGDLPQGQADAIRLVRLGGHSVEEASAISGQSASLVKINIHRGLKRLAAMVRGQ